MSISDENDRLTIIISKETKNALKEMAAKDKRSLSNYVASVLESHINNQNKNDSIK